jgi:hypothetical protein
MQQDGLSSTPKIFQGYECWPGIVGKGAPNSCVAATAVERFSREGDAQVGLTESGRLQEYMHLKGSMWGVDVLWALWGGRWLVTPCNTSLMLLQVVHLQLVPPLGSGLCSSLCAPLHAVVQQLLKIAALERPASCAALLLLLIAGAAPTGGASSGRRPLLRQHCSSLVTCAYLLLLSIAGAAFTAGATPGQRSLQQPLCPKACSSAAAAEEGIMRHSLPHV